MAEERRPIVAKRVAMFVFNEVDHDRRVLKEADALAAAGWSVTIHGIRKGGFATGDRRQRPSGVEIVRHGLTPRPALPPGWHPLLSLVVAPAFLLCLVGTAALARLGLGLGRQARSAIGLWAWGTAAARAAAGADVLHAHDLSGGVPALFAARVSGAPLVYDSHEVFLESVYWARAPRIVRSFMAEQVERPLLRRASALITVNPGVEEELGRRYDLPALRTVAYNCSIPRQASARGRELRDAIGVDDAAEVVLYHGGFSPHRGLEQLIAAFRDPRLPRAHLVFLGYGPLEPLLRDAAADPELKGRVHVLRAVDPEVLDQWISGADVGICTILPSTLNHRISTPNKLFESLAAGVPVVGSDFPTIRSIIMDAPEGPLGTVCDPSDPIAVAASIASILDQPAAEREALRRRCLAAARTRWNWAAQAGRLVALYREI